MGIDIYALWRGQTDAEVNAQCTGDLIDRGRVGYLREAYHGGPYATHVLMPEAFEASFEEGAAIAAATLLERLPAALETVRKRQALVYKQDADSEETKTVLKSFRDFVALCEKKEAETGETVRIVASY